MRKNGKNGPKEQIGLLAKEADGLVQSLKEAEKPDPALLGRAKKVLAGFRSIDKKRKKGKPPEIYQLEKAVAKLEGRKPPKRRKIKSKARKNAMPPIVREIKTFLEKFNARSRELTPARLLDEMEALWTKFTCHRPKKTQVVKRFLEKLKRQREIVAKNRKPGLATSRIPCNVSTFLTNLDRLRTNHSPEILLRTAKKILDKFRKTKKKKTAEIIRLESVIQKLKAEIEARGKPTEAEVAKRRISAEIFRFRASQPSGAAAEARP